MGHHFLQMCVGPSHRAWFIYITQVNESGTTVVTWSTDETVSFQVFDLRARRLTVTFQSTNATFSSDEIRLSPDGNLLLFMAEGIFF